MHAWVVLKSSGWCPPLLQGERGEYRIDLVFEPRRSFGCPPTPGHWMVTLSGRGEPDALRRILFLSSDPAAAQQAFRRELMVFFGPQYLAPGKLSSREAEAAA